MVCCARLIQAEKKLKGSILFKNQDRFEEAAELFQKAANQFKILLKWSEAANAFERVAACYRLAKQKYAEADALTHAAACHAKSDTSQAINCYKEASLAWQEDGKFINASKALQTAAQLYETQGEPELAVEEYMAAMNISQCENNAAYVTRPCLVKAALLYAQTDQLDQAIKIYEKLVDQSVDDKTLRFQVPTYLLNAGLCSLARDDIVSAQRNIDKYLEQDAYFAAHPDGQFLRQIFDAVLQGDLDAFNKATVEYDKICRLDPWRITIMLRIKKIISPSGEEATLPSQLDDIADDDCDSNGLL